MTALVLLLAYTLNVLDAGLTAGALLAGTATEGNPLMAYLWDVSPYLFFFVKCVACLYAFYILFERRHLRLARVGAWLALVVYLGILVLHVGGLHG